MSNDDCASAGDTVFAKGSFSQGSDKLPIILVEDEPDQALLVQDALKEDNSLTLLPVVKSGEEAIAYLSGQGEYADRTTHPLPFLILLDLHMPGIGGFGVLRWLQNHPEVNEKLQVVVLSSDQSSREIELAGELGVKQYWVKSDWMLLRQRIRDLKTLLSDEDPW